MFNNETAGVPVVIREGSSHRTAEELCAVFVADVASVVSDVHGRPDQIERANALSADAVKALADDDLDALDDLVHCAEMLLGEVSEGCMWADWNDGYVIYESEV